MNDPHREWRERLGAFVLGHLEPEERAAVQAHLDGCSSCRTEAAELSQAAALLPAADPARVGVPEPAPAGLEERIVHRVTEARRTRRRRRLGIAAAVLVVAASASVLGVALWPRTPAERVTLAADGAWAEAELVSRAWGTEIRLRVGDVGESGTYGVWLEQSDGDRLPAGTFRAVPGRDLEVVFASGLSRTDAVALGVSDSEGETVLRAVLPPADA